MKRLNIFKFALWLCIVTFLGCGKEETTSNNNEEPCIVSLAFVGEISSSNEPLVRSKSTDDLYLVLVYEDGKVYADGVFDNIGDMIILLNPSKQYKFVATMLKNGKNIIAPEGIPFSITDCKNTFSYSDTSKYESRIKYGSATVVDEYGENNIPPVDRYYGEFDMYTPQQNGAIYIEMKRVSFGLQYEVIGVSDGEVKVVLAKYYNDPISVYAQGTHTQDFVSEEFIYTFPYVYEAWKNAENYTWDVKVTVTWTRGNGVIQDLGSKWFSAKRNRMNIVRITLSEDKVNSSLGINVESEDTMNTEIVTISAE